jgi:acetyl-CoA acetyltransferase
VIAAQAAPKKAGTSTLYQRTAAAGGNPYGGPALPQPEDAFWQPAGISTRGATVGMITSRYLHEYHITREQLGHVVVTQRENAGDSLTMEQYLAAPPVIGPLSELDATPDFERAFAVAVITTTASRARDLAQPLVLLSAAATGGTPSHATHFQTPDDTFASAGHRDVARDLYAMAGIGPDDVDVALLSDDFSPLVLMQLEDYGFCAAGEAGEYVARGSTQAPGGKLPVNPHGGNLSSASARGITHVYEAVQQLRDRATNQVDGVEVALVTGSPATIPLSAAILTRG